MRRIVAGLVGLAILTGAAGADAADFGMTQPEFEAALRRAGLGEVTITGCAGEEKPESNSRMCEYKLDGREGSVGAVYGPPNGSLAMFVVSFPSGAWATAGATLDALQALVALPDQVRLSGRLLAKQAIEGRNIAFDTDGLECKIGPNPVDSDLKAAICGAN